MKNIQLRRSVAFLIDMGIISILVSVFDNLFPVTLQVNNFEVSGIPLTLGITLAPVFYIVYFIIFDVVAGGQSVGKSVSGIFVVSKTGEVLSIRKCFVRSLYKMLGILLISPLLMAILFIFYNYTIQDYCTDTRTIRAGEMLNKS